MPADKSQKVRIITPEFRGSYCNLVTPRAIEEGQEPKYSILIVLPKEDKETVKFISRLKAEIDRASTAKWGKPVPHAKLKHFPIRDGDQDDNDDFHGHWLVPASNKFKPSACDMKGQKLFDTESLYSGAWYRVSVSAWAWSHKTGGNGVSINLDAVLKVKDDAAFGGGAKAEDEFKDLIDDEGDSGHDDDDMFK